jgi:hypothetical protein
MKYLLSFALILVSSCSDIAKMSGGYEQVQVGGNGKVSIVLSGNVNGETHPCGCRHFPLGGLDNVAGAFEQIRQKGHSIVYLDAGDHFFPSNNIPENLRKGLEYTSQSIAKADSMLGLNFMIPGDQDYASGETYLANLAKSQNLQFLLTNASKNNGLPYKPWAKIIFGKAKVYLIGLVDPETLGPSEKASYLQLDEGMQLGLDQIKRDGYDPENKMHRLLVLSHSGIDRDRELAKKFPMIDWILGAHTQSFIRIPFEEGKTKMVQVLSRNHYLGEIVLDLNQESSKDEYQLIEIRDELMKAINPNPYTAFLDEHKNQLMQIRNQEQIQMTSTISDGVVREISTAKNCIECHQDQGKFWSGTPHALAYLTLVRVKEANNLQCLQCHVLGLGQPGGPQKHSELAQLKFKHQHSKTEEAHEHDFKEIESKNDEASNKQYQEQLDRYWKEVFAKTPLSKVMRTADKKIIRQGVETWMNLDKKHHVVNNYANVQCLNCHTKHPDHPFNSANESPDKPDLIAGQIRAKCLECHDADQSPEWYGLNASGGEGKLNEAAITKHYQKLRCPTRK